ncbi:MAG TPA: cupin domain-containing protein [Blastocatellia bacterium]|nr:cupin domain-containing protein [Blastocatellia bacterium]
MIVVNRDDAAIINTPHGSQIRPLIDRTDSPITKCSLAEEVLPPGCSVARHHHNQIEEIYYIVDGAGTMTVGEESKPVKAGDSIYVPPGSIHSLSNTGTEPIKLLLVCGPAFYYEDHIFEQS